MPRGDGGRRTTTGRRLALAFAALTCAFGAALAFVFLGLRQMEPALGGIQQLEEKARILLALEIAVREQYAQGLLAGDGERPRAADYQSIRRHVEALQRSTAEQGDDPEAAELAGSIERATAELDRLHRERAASVRRADRRVVEDRAYSILLLIDDLIDRLEARKSRAAVELRQKVSALQRTTLGWTAAFLAGAPLLSFGVALAIRRAVAKPMARLGEAAQRLARGEMEARIEIRSRDEFGTLADQFNAMAEALVRHQRDMVHSEKLASLGRLAAGVAHELNNPLSVMIGYLMLHRRKAEGGLAEDLQKVEREAYRCRDIVRDLLELARPSGAFERGPVDLRQLCDEVVADLRESGQLTEAQLSVEGVGAATGNRAKLRQVVWNLVKNGAEAAGRGGRIQVRVESFPEAIEVAVADDGPGMSAEARARIFEPFFTTKPAGTGLGLAVSRAIARAHGGDLAVRDALGRGAVLAMRLPRAEGRA